MIRNYRHKWQVLAVTFFVLALWACGYTFSPHGEHIDARIKNIYVEPFGNKTAQAELENYVRTAFIDQILQRSRFKTVASAEQADAVIGGNVLRYTTQTLTYSKTDMASSERAIIILEVNFRDLQTGKTIWSSRELKGQLDYGLGSDINLLMATRKNYFTKLSKDTVEIIFDSMMSNF